MIYIFALIMLLIAFILLIQILLSSFGKGENTRLINHSNIKENFEQYYPLIIEQRLASIDELSKRVNKYETQVILEIQELIDHKYIYNTSIDEYSRMLVYEGKPEASLFVTCPKCGAENEKSKEACIFCGSKLG